MAMKSCAVLVAVIAGIAAAPVHAGVNDRAREEIALWPGPPPGTEDWSGPETVTRLPVPGQVEVRMVGNVTLPTLTVYRPNPGAANGTAVIVIPGGGFQMLAMNHEGELVARWLAVRGVTAFLLKYRVRMIPGFQMPPDLRSNPEQFAQFKNSFSYGIPIAVADATQALRYVRANAAHFDIAPDRIGMIGFSAGAITTMGVVMHDDAADRPDFAAPIYGSMDGRVPPSGAPPLFIAVTQDDNAVPAPESIAIFNRWTAAGLPAELHVYESGGHGFGMMLTGKPADQWTTAFEAWMKAHGWIDRPGAQP